jgi:hypothetical protein
MAPPTGATDSTALPAVTAGLSMREAIGDAPVSDCEASDSQRTLGWSAFRRLAEADVGRKGDVAKAS